MKWKKYTIHTTSLAEDPISALLYDLGISGIEIEDKVPVTPEESGNMFGDVVPDMPEDDHLADISFYTELPETEDTVLLLERVRTGLEEIRSFCEIGEGTITTSETEEEDWINNWKEYFHRFFVDDIEIIPSWEEEQADPEASMVLHIDPGTAFGTGKHETTQLAIRGLRKRIAELLEQRGNLSEERCDATEDKCRDNEEITLLDIGTGSGILGIIALKSGADFVYGTDIDPVAFPALEDNLEKNDLDGSRFVRACADVITDAAARKAASDAALTRKEHADREEIKEALKKAHGVTGYDIVTANIIAEILVELTPYIPRFLKEGGVYITSGILREKEQLVRNAMEKAGLKVLGTEYQGDWCSVTAVKES